MFRKKLMKRYALRKDIWVDLLNSLETPPGNATDIRTSPIYDEVNYTDDRARTEFGWRMVTPEDLLHENETQDGESVRTTDYAQKTWNGQGRS